MPNWPVTTTSITEGTIIKASDLENNFNVLKNAANTLHERFSTLSFSCMVDSVLPSVYTNGTGSDAAVHASLNSYDYLIPIADGSVAPNNQVTTDYAVYGIFQVPSWCQAVRVRTFDVLNSSVLPNPTDLGVADHTDGPLEVGVRFVSSISAFDQNAGSAPGTSITSVTFPYSGNFAKGYSGSRETYPVVKQSAPGTLVLGGQYIVVYGRGGLTYTLNNGEKLSATHYRFHVNLMCDAMVPIP